MVPDAQTAKHVAGFGQLMPERAFAVPDTWVDQVRPPSAERRMTPASPTPKQITALGQLTPMRFLAVPEAPLDQLRPPSIVISVVPDSPTRTQWEISAQLSPDNGFPCGSGFCQTQLPVPVGIAAAAELGPACPTSASARHKPAASRGFRDTRRLLKIPPAAILAAVTRVVKGPLSLVLSLPRLRGRVGWGASSGRAPSFPSRPAPPPAALPARDTASS